MIIELGGQWIRTKVQFCSTCRQVMEAYHLNGSNYTINELFLGKCIPPEHSISQYRFGS